MFVKKFPLIITPKEITSIRADHARLKHLLLDHGALLLRGFHLSHAEDFSRAVQEMELGPFSDYVGGDSPRSKICKGVYTSTEAPPSVKIALHNELSFMKHYPSHIFFFCETPPKAHGETIIASSKTVYKSIRPEVRNRFEQKGICYTSHYPETHSWIRKVIPYHRPWSVVFDTEDPKEVEKLCKKLGISYRWYPSGWLETKQNAPAVIYHPLTNEKLWFNQAHLFDLNAKLLGWWHFLATKLIYTFPHTKLHSVTFGDGSPIPKEDLYHILDVLDQCTVYFPWQKGDLLMLDNRTAMHGRATFNGPRRILTAMTEL